MNIQEKRIKKILTYSLCKQKERSKNVMTIKEFSVSNMEKKKKVLAASWNGEGYVYKLKKSWESIRNDEIVYVPEMGFESMNGVATDVFSKKDLLDICKGDDAEAQTLFESLSWAYPSTEYEQMLMSCD